MIDPSTSKEVKQEVKQEVKESVAKYSWIRRDLVIVLVLFVVLGTLSVVQILSLRETNNNADQLQRAVLTERQWAEVTTVCILNVSGQVNFGQIPYTPEAIQEAVSECIQQEGKKRGIPGSNGPITTTTLPNTPTSLFTSTSGG